MYREKTGFRSQMVNSVVFESDVIEEVKTHNFYHQNISSPYWDFRPCGKIEQKLEWLWTFLKLAIAHCFSAANKLLVNDRNLLTNIFIHDNIIYRSFNQLAQRKNKIKSKSQITEMIDRQILEMITTAKSKWYTENLS